MNICICCSYRVNRMLCFMYCVVCVKWSQCICSPHIYLYSVYLRIDFWSDLRHLYFGLLYLFSCIATYWYGNTLLLYCDWYGNTLLLYCDTPIVNQLLLTHKEFNVITLFVIVAPFKDLRTFGIGSHQNEFLKNQSNRRW